MGREWGGLEQASGTAAALQPTFRAVPVGGFPEALFGRDFGLPEVGGYAELGVDDPIAVRELGGAVYGQLRFWSAEQLVGARRETKEYARSGDDGGPPRRGVSGR